MNTSAPEEFDYPRHVKQHGVEAKKVSRGTRAREMRRAGVKERITIRIDQDVLERFKELTPQGQGYQSLINEALRDWLSARGVKELIREELEEMTEKVVLAIQSTRRVPSK
jgi:uncharacterized protein (DUF4415 family)